MLVLLSLLALSAEPSTYFRITVVDDQTGRGVPLVELRTVNHLRYVTDSAGVVAFHEPGWMDQEVFFHVSSHGYEFKKDGFGFRGQRLKVTPGGSATLSIKRLNVAQRLYRVTGGGIYADTILCGGKPPLREPSLNAQVLGSDSVVNAIYGGKLHWFWGDTNRAAYPLGNFNVPGATSRLPADGGLDPATGVDLDYFVNSDGFAKETCRMPGEGPTWIGGLTVLREVNSDGKDRERMFATYIKVKGQFDVYERGLAEWNAEKQEFQHSKKLDLASNVFSQGHSFKHTDGGVEYVYFGDPYPALRCKATVESYLGVEGYEAFTCLKPGVSANVTPARNATEGVPYKIDRDEAGAVQWGWKKNAVPISHSLQEELIAANLLKPEEAWLTLVDVDGGKNVVAHRGSVAWNAYRKKWLLSAVQTGGTSFLGEVWYAEADTPEGPYRKAKKIITHNKYSFYNPKQHPYFAQDGGRVIYFEGTYTHTFSGNADATPRYDYNQMLYSLDLADERLKAAQE